RAGMSVSLSHSVEALPRNCRRGLSTPGAHEAYAIVLTVDNTFCHLYPPPGLPVRGADGLSAYWLSPILESKSGPKAALTLWMQLGTLKSDVIYY
ncbi:hypothetical protein N7376_24485, partial [Brucella intermedia GD04153]